MLLVELVAPRRRGQEPGNLPGEIDARRMTDPELGCPLLLGVAPVLIEHRADVVEEDVGRHLQRLRQLERAVRTAAGVVQGDPALRERPPVHDRRARSHDSALECRDRGDRLEGRARRVQALDRAVGERRSGRVGGELLVGRLGDHRLREYGGIEGGRGAEPEDLPVLDVHRHERAGGAEGVDRGLPRLLHRRVDAEQQVVARLWLGFAEHPAGRLSRGVHLHASHPVGPAQDVVIGVLDPGLPDLVARDQALVARLVELLLGDLTDVAVDLGTERPVRVVAHVNPLNRHPRVGVLVLSQVVDEVVADVALERHRVGRDILGLLVELLADRLGGHPDHRAQPGELALAPAV